MTLVPVHDAPESQSEWALIPVDSVPLIGDRSLHKR